MNKKTAVLASLSLCFLQGIGRTDSIPGGFSRSPEWHIGAEISGGRVPGTNDFLKGNNPSGKAVRASLSGDLRADFSFSPSTREGILYKGLYQGIGAGISSYFSPELLGTPVSLYVFQGAPVKRFSRRLWLGYEWQFGAAFGWRHFDEWTAEDNVSVSTPVTAHMGIGLKLHYSLSERWRMALGVSARHYSNGNTSWPNAGLNSFGVTVGISYVINPQTSAPETSPDPRLICRETGCHEWFYDLTAYGAWRKRVVYLPGPDTHELCPGRFGIAGIQFSPMYRLNRWTAIGPGLDMQWDESAGLAPYWIEGTGGDYIKFVRPPFGKQISIGVSAHAELIMPIFSVNAGIGYSALCPQGDSRFYQSLTLKTFLTRHLFISVGYRLGRFRDPQNLMIGAGVRF